MTTTLSTVPAGVMDASYVRDRLTRTHLSFRLRARAQVVVRATWAHGLRGPLKLLDVGAAEGRTLLEMVKSYGVGEYVGVEYSEEIRKLHPPLPSNVRLLAGDAHALPDELERDHFDAVSMLALLEHLPDPMKALAEARRVLRPGGLIVATCPNPMWDAVAGRLGLVRDEHHMQRIDRKRLAELIAEAGFEVLSARPFMWAPVAILPYLRLRVPPGLALGVDGIVGRIPLVRGLCVNAFVVGRRPE